VGFRALVGPSDTAAQTLGKWVRASRMSSSDALRETSDTQTSLEPILLALEHIEARGSLQGLLTIIRSGSDL
jgi:hypothetical protein